MSRVPGWMKLYPRKKTTDETVWQSMRSNPKLIVDKVQDDWFVELFADELLALVCFAQIGDPFRSEADAMRSALAWMKLHPEGAARQ